MAAQLFNNKSQIVSFNRGLSPIIRYYSQVVHTQYRQAYGAIKTWRHLNNNGISCGKHRVARLRREAGIEAKRKARFRVTVEHHKMPQAAPDLLQRKFNPPVPNQAWVGDINNSYK